MANADSFNRMIYSLIFVDLEKYSSELSQQDHNSQLKKTLIELLDVESPLDVIYQEAESKKRAIDKLKTSQQIQTERYAWIFTSGEEDDIEVDD